MRYGTPIEKKKELDKFYNKVDEYKLNKIISLDETSIKPSMLVQAILECCLLKVDLLICFLVSLLIWNSYAKFT